MASTPTSTFSSFPSDDDTIEGYLLAEGTGLSDPACSDVVKRRRMLELVKRLRNAGWVHWFHRSIRLSDTDPPHVS